MSGDQDQITTRPGVRIPKASDLVANHIRAMVLHKGLEPGTPLPSESELMEVLGLSRASVREGFRLLESEGLIVIRRGPKGGVAVGHPDITHVSRSLALLFTIEQTPLKSFFEFRCLVEPHAAALAARDASDEQRQALLRHARVTDATSQQAARFHHELSKYITNDIFRVLLVAMHEVLDVHIGREALTDDDIHAVERVHLRIAEAIADGDEQRASRAMRKHLEAFQDLLEGTGRLDLPIVPRSRWTENSQNGGSLGPVEPLE